MGQTKGELMEFKSKDYVYYRHKNGDTYPAQVFRCSEKRVYIKYNGLDRDYIAWVKPENLTLQEESDGNVL